MARVTVTLTGVCGGGNHLTFAVTGAREATIQAQRDELLEPITHEDAVSFVKVLGKMARAGRTNAQAAALLQAGVTVEV